MLKIFFYFIIIINKIVLIKSQTKNSNIISLKFKTYYPCTNNSIYNPSNFTTDDYFESIHLSKLYLEVGVGDENNFKTNTSQIINIIIDIKEIIFCSTNLYFEKFTNENNNKLCHYNTSKSSTFNEIPKYYELNEIKSLSSYATEFFKIYLDISLSKYKIQKLNFVNTINHNSSNICGNIGLKFSRPESKDYNFMGQIHSKFDLLEYSFLFNYSNLLDNEGIFIFGNMPHVYLPNKFNIDNLIPINYLGFNEPLIELYEIKMEREGYKIDSKDQQYKMKITSDIEGFEVPGNTFMDIEDIFFQKYYGPKICHKKEYNRNYYIVYCDAENEKFGQKDIKAFPNITLFIDKISNLSICFDGDDLFYFKNNKYFFKIVSNKENNFILGRLLFKKYLIIFNLDKKQIYFYNNNIFPNNNNNKNNKSSKSNKKYTIKIIIISGIVVAIIFFALGIYFGKKIFKQRKQKAYELNDGYDYSNQENDEKFDITI